MSNNRAQEQVRVEVAEIKRSISTLKALAVVLEGETRLTWLPRSQVHSETVENDTPVIYLTPFIAKKIGY